MAWPLAAGCATCRGEAKGSDVIITKPRDWERIERDLNEVGARSVFIYGCGQCATVAHTGGVDEAILAKETLEQRGWRVTGWEIGEVACHLGGTKLEMRKNAEGVAEADAILVLTCGAGVQTVADSVEDTPVFPGLESAFLGNVIRHGVFEERCQMCGECVLDLTAGICPVTTCPKGLLNGPCGGMWDGMCEVVEDRECTWVRITRRLEIQGREDSARIAPPKDFSKSLKPGALDLREAGRRGGNTR